MNTLKNSSYNSCLHILDVIEMKFGKKVLWCGNFDRSMIIKSHSIIDKLKLNDILFTDKAYVIQDKIVAVDQTKFGIYSRDASVDLDFFWKILSKNSQ